jgi:hypothetical protein
MNTRLAPLTFATAIFICVAPAQEFPSLSYRVGRNEATITFGPPRALSSITGAPYSADQMMEHTITPAGDASRTKTAVIGHFFRDSRGRTRMERAQKPAPIWLTEIFDPVGRFGYLLDEQNKVAHRMALQEPLATTETDQSGTQSQTISEKLGTRTIEGVIAEGTRTTTTFHAGAVGNSSPKSLTIETWDSEELNVSVLTRSSNGYSTWLANLSRAEPDPTRFQPPVDYTVVDDKDSFTLTIKFQ